jgi:hypothetical protein
MRHNRQASKTDAIPAAFASQPSIVLLWNFQIIKAMTVIRLHHQLARSTSRWNTLTPA